MGGFLKVHIGSKNSKSFRSLLKKEGYTFPRKRISNGKAVQKRPLNAWKEKSRLQARNAGSAGLSVRGRDKRADFLGSVNLSFDIKMLRNNKKS